MATFAERLAQLRKARDWTKAQMYRTMDIAPGTLANYLSGKNSPNIDTVRAYAKRLGVSVGWLAGEETDNAHVLNYLVCYDDSGNVTMVAKILKEIDDAYVVEQFGACDISAEMLLGGEPDCQYIGDMCDVYEIRKDELTNPKLFYSWLGVKGEVARDFARRRQNAV